jgi:hypothetical protein
MDEGEASELPQLVEASGAQAEPGKVAGSTAPFAEVKRKRKRVRGADMDTSEGAGGDDSGESSVKRPAFPPVNVSASLVSLVVGA